MTNLDFSFLLNGCVMRETEMCCEACLYLPVDWYTKGFLVLILLLYHPSYLYTEFSGQVAPSCEVFIYYLSISILYIVNISVLLNLYFSGANCSITWRVYVFFHCIRSWWCHTSCFSMVSNQNKIHVTSSSTAAPLTTHFTQVWFFPLMLSCAFVFLCFAWS